LITILDLIRNGTLSAEVAATLWSGVEAQRSFLTVALPRLAGKTTTTEAVLALRPPEVPLHRVDGRRDVMERLQQERHGGYLVVAEFSRAPMPGYIWGEPVRRVFETLPAGYSLQAALHAHNVDEAIQIVARGNGLDDDQMSAVDFVIYIELFGRSWTDLWRRVAEVYEVDRVEDSRPVGRPLFRWRSQQDDFEQVGEPRGFGAGPADQRERAGLLAELAGSGATPEQLAAAVERYRSDRGG
jgi:hypothetical protein